MDKKLKENYKNKKKIMEARLKISFWFSKARKMFFPGLMEENPGAEIFFFIGEAGGYNESISKKKKNHLLGTGLATS